jgi:AcrR family transcriptional regulator
VSQPSSFTVNDIAKEAGVTTSLLYFYFQSKDDIIVETLRTIASDLDTLAADANSPTDMASVVSVSLAKRPAFARIVAWFVLEGRSITDEMGDHPFMQRLIMTLAENESEDPLTQSGAVVAHSSPAHSWSTVSIQRWDASVTTRGSRTPSMG